MVDAAALPGARRQPGIRGQLAAVAEIAEERLARQHRGCLGANALEPQQSRPGAFLRRQRRRGGTGGILTRCCRYVASRTVDARGRKCRVANRLHVRKLLHGQFEAVYLTPNLGREPGRQGGALWRAHCRQPRPPVTQGRLEPEHAPGCEQAFDAIGMPDAFGQQGLPFAIKPAGILCLARRRAHHGAHLPLAARPGHERAQHSLGIDPIRLALRWHSNRCAAGTLASSARRLRRFTAIDAGSTTTLLIAWASSKRCTQNPSRPASCMTTTSTGCRKRRSARSRRRFNTESRPAPSQAVTPCLLAFSSPGALATTTQLDRLSSRATNSVAFISIASEGSGRVAV